MTIYIDSEFICHTEPAEGRTAIETEFFDNSCDLFIEKYRYVPAGETWVRSDGIVFHGETAAPIEDARVVQAYQEGYDAAQAEMADMRAALAVFGVVEEDANELEE